MENPVRLTAAKRPDRCVKSLSLVDHQRTRHHIVQRLFLVGESGHQKAETQDQPR
jgi:hypothetical protein